MEEKERYYNNYLNDKLDLVFSENKESTYKNILSFVLLKENNIENTIYKKEDGYSIIKINNKFNFIDKNGKIISEKWYDRVYDFKNDYSRVEINNKYNYINHDGNLISEEWYDKAFDFESDSAIVKKDEKFLKLKIDKSTKKITKTTQEYNYTDSFSFKYAIIKEDSKYNYIDIDDRILCKEWYDYCYQFKNGYAKVKNNGKYNFIDLNGNLVSNRWYDYAQDYSDSYFVVEFNGKYNFIDNNGNLFNSNWYEHVEPFNDGYAVSIEKGKYNFIDKKGNILKNISYDYCSSFKDGYAIVGKNNNYNYIDKKGNLISQTWYEKIYYYTKEYARVMNDGKYNYIDKKGILKSQIWFDEAYDFEDEYAVVKINNQLNYIDKNFKPIKQLGFDKNYLNITQEENMKDYKIKKKLLSGYRCESKNEVFDIKYYPIKKYGFENVLCLNSDKIYLYNIIKKYYQYIGKASEIIYDDNFIYDGKNIYLIYNDKKLDITNYYKDKLIYKNEINVSKDINNILTKDEFLYSNSSQIKEMLEKEKKKNEEIKKNREKELEMKSLRKKDEQRKLEEQANKQKILIAQNIIKKGMKILDETKPSQIERIKLDNIFKEVDDHKEIIETLKEYLEYIDLSLVDFKNVNVEGIDFRSTNANIYPQDVYKKSLRNCDFTGINIQPFFNLNGVDIRGTKFSIDEDPMTIDFLPLFKGSIYDDTTTYNNIPLKEVIENKENLTIKKR